MSTTESKPDPTPAFRVDANLHQALKQPATPRELGIHDSEDYVEGGLPEVVFPQHPEVRWETDRAYHNFKAWRLVKSMGTPYFKSRVLANDLRPLIAYLFTE